MPPLNVSRPDAPASPPAYGLFSLNWLVPDAESPTHWRALHRVQAGVDLSAMDLRSGRLFFRRNAPDPLALAVRRWCWGHAAQHALARAITEAWREEGLGSTADASPGRLVPADAAVLRERFSVGGLSARDRGLDPLREDGPRLGEVQVDVAASALVQGPSGTMVFYDPGFARLLVRAADAVRDELSDLLTQHLDRSRLVFAHHHNDPSDLGAIQRLLLRAGGPGAQPIVAPPETLGPVGALDERLVQDAQAVREAAREAFTDPSQGFRPRGSTP